MSKINSSGKGCARRRENFRVILSNWDEINWTPRIKKDAAIKEKVLKYLNKNHEQQSKSS